MQYLHLAKKIQQTLRTRFGNTTKVKRLEGRSQPVNSTNQLAICDESSGNLQVAMNLYEEMADENKLDSTTVKRQVAVLRVSDFEFMSNPTPRP